MKLFIDSANVEEIRRFNSILKVDGVTTNPSILTREHKPFDELISGICGVLNEDQILFVQVVSTEYDTMMAEARYIAGIRKNIAVKVPVTETGLRVIRSLHEEGIPTLGTSVLSAANGFMGAVNGASYLAPYVNRMCNYTDGVNEACLLQEMIDDNGLACDVIAASLKNTGQVRDLIAGGIRALTLPLDILEQLVNSPLADQAVEQFTAAWEKEYGRTTLR